MLMTTFHLGPGTALYNPPPARMTLTNLLFCIPLEMNVAVADLQGLQMTLQEVSNLRIREMYWRSTNTSYKARFVSLQLWLFLP